MTLAQIVVTPATLNVLLTGVIALQTWLVKRSYALEAEVKILAGKFESKL